MNIMKAIKILVCLAVFSLVTVACADDYTNPADLVGTTWVASNYGSYEYAALKFTSTTALETWLKPKNKPEFKNATATYTISGNKISFYPSPSSQDHFDGNIDKTKITYTMKSSTNQDTVMIHYKK